MNNPDNSSYHIPKLPASYQEVIKRSRFIVDIARTPDVTSAKLFIEEIREKYSDARHHCWAHIAGSPCDNHALGFSDDGEPNGTAGKPMLNVLTGSGLGEITAVVTRYFGGIKLGTGGLVRAYGGSLNHALKELITTEKIPETIIEGISEYSHQGIIEQIFSSYKILDIKKDFSNQVNWKVKIDRREAPLAISEILDKTSGRVQFKNQDEL